MVLRLARPGTVHRQFRRRYPAGIKRIVGRVEPPFGRPRGWVLTASHRVSALPINDGQRPFTPYPGREGGVVPHLGAEPRHLSRKDTLVLADEDDRRMVDAREDGPGVAKTWIRAGMAHLNAEMRAAPVPGVYRTGRAQAARLEAPARSCR